MSNHPIFSTFLLLLIIIFLFCYSDAYAFRNNRAFSHDVQSMFFSPFRMIGKRSQFYGLYKKMQSHEVPDY